MLRMATGYLTLLNHDSFLPYANLRFLQLIGSSATLCGEKIRSPDHLDILNDQAFPSIDLFSSLMAQTYSKMAMPGFIRLKLGPCGSGSMGHHFSHKDRPPQSVDLKSNENIENLASIQDFGK